MGSTIVDCGPDSRVARVGMKRFQWIVTIVTGLWPVVVYAPVIIPSHKTCVGACVEMVRGISFGSPYVLMLYVGAGIAILVAVLHRLAPPRQRLSYLAHPRGHWLPWIGLVAGVFVLIFLGLVGVSAWVGSKRP